MASPLIHRVRRRPIVLIPQQHGGCVSPAGCPRFWLLSGRRGVDRSRLGRGTRPALTWGVDQRARQALEQAGRQGNWREGQLIRLAVSLIRTATIQHTGPDGRELHRWPAPAAWGSPCPAPTSAKGRRVEDQGPSEWPAANGNWCCRRPVGSCHLIVVFRLAARAIEAVIEPLLARNGRCFSRRTDIEALVGGLDPRHHPHAAGPDLAAYWVSV